MSCVYQSAPGLAPDPEVWACHNPLLSLKIRGHTRLSSQNTSLQNGPTWGKQRGSVRCQACGQELTIKPSVPMKPGNVDIEIIFIPMDDQKTQYEIRIFSLEQKWMTTAKPHAYSCNLVLPISIFEVKRCILDEQVNHMFSCNSIDTARVWG